MLVSSNRGACWGPGETHLQGPSFFGMQPAQHVLNILAVKVLYVFSFRFPSFLIDNHQPVFLQAEQFEDNGWAHICALRCQASLSFSFGLTSVACEERPTFAECVFACLSAGRAAGAPVSR